MNQIANLPQKKAFPIKPILIGIIAMGLVALAANYYSGASAENTLQATEFGKTLEKTGVDFQNPPCPEALPSNFVEFEFPRLNGSKRLHFQDTRTGLIIGFDRLRKSAKYPSHYHIYNPNWFYNRIVKRLPSGKIKDPMYIDVYGRPTGKGTKPSHIDINKKNCD